MTIEFIQTAAHPEHFEAVEWCAEVSAADLSVYQVVAEHLRALLQGATHVAVAARTRNLYVFSMHERRVTGMPVDRVMSIGPHAWC